MFKNHKNYMKLRNKINEQENSHSEMFDTITKKLTDHSFIQSAIELSSETEAKSKSQHKAMNSTAGAGGANSVSS
jgi:mannitol/fructose-specific phosphotransferase system IIA component (Ntr-type)